jgi:hypothetical protein
MLVLDSQGLLWATKKIKPACKSKARNIHIILAFKLKGRKSILTYRAFWQKVSAIFDQILILIYYREAAAQRQ